MTACALNYTIGRGGNMALLDFYRDRVENAERKPEATATVRLRMPADVGEANVHGVHYVADDERTITVPAEFAQQLIMAGYARVGAREHAA